MQYSLKVDKSCNIVGLSSHDNQIAISHGSLKVMFDGNHIH